MSLSLTRRKLLGAALLAGGLPAVVRAAREYPTRTITMIVPYPAGGPADLIARQMLPTLRKSLGQTVIVDNISGAGGAVGIRKLLAAPADGHFLVIGTPSDVVLGPLTLTAVKHRPEHLRLLGLVSRAPLVLVSGTQLPARKLDDLLGAARHGKEYTYGSIGIGSLYHLAAEDLAARTKLRMTHVPYKGVAPLMQDLIGGQIDLAFLPSAGNLVDMIGQGKLRAYAVTDGRRLARLPDVPTITEAAGQKDFDYEIWGGPFVARGVPDDVAERLNKAVNDAVQDAEFRRQIEAGGSVVGAPMSLAEAERFLADQTARYRRLSQQIKVDPR